VKKKELIKKIDFYLNKLFNINRSITGPGNRQTLKEIKKIIPIKIKSVKSLQKVFDWKIPLEWDVRDAYIKNDKGEKIIDFKKNNLHLASYSKPIRKKILKWSYVKKHLILSKKNKNFIPYRTLYYKKDWAFCCNFKQYKKLKNNKKIEVSIDSKFYKGSLNYGELLIKGKSKKEILISTYICHPSMANDNLSGIILTAFLVKKILQKKLKWSYRVIFIPETIGAIAYSHLNQNKFKLIKCGVVVSCVGGPGKIYLKKSWNKNHFINLLAYKSLKKLSTKYISNEFDINGSDERQFSSIGFRLNTITISKNQYYKYKEYHSSADDLNFVKANNIYKTLRIYEELIYQIEKVKIYENKIKYCEPMLSKYKLYPEIGGNIIPNKKYTKLDLILWILHLADGTKSNEYLSNYLNVKLSIVNLITKKLEKNKILEKINI